MTPRETWQRIAANKIALASIIFLGLMVLAAIFLPIVLPFGSAHQLPDSPFVPAGVERVFWARAGSA